MYPILPKENWEIINSMKKTIVNINHQENPNRDHCPNCSSEYIVRVHRNIFSKMIIRRKKYFCPTCGKHFYGSKKSD